MEKDKAKEVLLAQVVDSVVTVDCDDRTFHGTWTVNKVIKHRGRGAPVSLQMTNKDGHTVELWSSKHGKDLNSVTLSEAVASSM